MDHGESQDSQRVIAATAGTSACEPTASHSKLTVSQSYISVICAVVIIFVAAARVVAIVVISISTQLRKKDIQVSGAV